MKEYKSNTPAELMRRLGEGSEDALAAVISLCKPGMLRLIGFYTRDQYLAEEIFLDVMQTLWEKRKRVAKLNNAYTWLMKVARNKTLNRIRDRHADRIVDLDQAYGMPDKITAGNELDAADFEILISDAVKQLSPREKQVFLLSIRYGWNTKAIAANLEITESTVRSQLSNALRKIRSGLMIICSVPFV